MVPCSVFLILNSNPMAPHKRLQVAAFLGLLLIVLGLVFQVVRPFLNMLVMAGILTILFRPVYWRIRKYVKSDGGAAGLTTLLIVVIILLPVWLFGQILFNELVNLYHSVRAGEFVINKDDIIKSLPEGIRGFIQSISADFNTLANKFTANAFNTFTQIVSNIASFALAFFLVMFSTFYFLKDGHHFKQIFMDVSPIANSQEDILLTKIASAVNGVVKGAFLMALVQGIVATIGYFIFGVPNPMLWGLFTILAALVPTVGTAIALVPAILYLLITGHVGSAIGLIIWGALAVGLIDNVLGPKVTGGLVKLHPLLVLISVLGGVSFFGFIGFLLGPILMAVFVAMVDMYRKDFQEYLEK